MLGWVGTQVHVSVLNNSIRNRLYHFRLFLPFGTATSVYNQKTKCSVRHIFTIVAKKIGRSCDSKLALSVQVFNTVRSFLFTRTQTMCQGFVARSNHGARWTIVSRSTEFSRIFHERYKAIVWYTHSICRGTKATFSLFLYSYLYFFSLLFYRLCVPPERSDVNPAPVTPATAPV